MASTLLNFLPGDFRFLRNDVIIDTMCNTQRIIVQEQKSVLGYLELSGVRHTFEKCKIRYKNDSYKPFICFSLGHTSLHGIIGNIQFDQLFEAEERISKFLSKLTKHSSYEHPT